MSESDRAIKLREQSGRSTPGAGFPVVSLAEASRIIREAGKYSSSHSVPAFASYMGHTSSTSGPFRQRLAAFRDWKVVDRTGDTVSLTGLGMQIAHSSEPDEAMPALREAFFNAVPFRTLYENSAKGVPLKVNTLSSQAVLNLHVAAQSKRKFIQSFVDSAVFAGLAEVTGDTITLLAAIPAGAPALDTPVPPVAGRSNEGGGGQIPLPDVVLNQKWTDPDVEVRLIVASRRTLPTDAFPTIGRAVSECQSLFDLLVRKGDADAP